MSIVSAEQLSIKFQRGKEDEGSAGGEKGATRSSTCSFVPAGRYRGCWCDAHFYNKRGNFFSLSISYSNSLRFNKTGKKQRNRRMGKTAPGHSERKLIDDHLDGLLANRKITKNSRRKCRMKTKKLILALENEPRCTVSRVRLTMQEREIRCPFGSMERKIWASACFIIQLHFVLAAP